MSGVQIFRNAEFGAVRIVDVTGEPWFVAKDVARALGYPESSLRQLNNLFGHVPDEWKGRNWIMTPGGEQEMLIISEQGLYFFLARSDKAAALPYQMWVAGDVMPSIRRHGAYLTPARLEEALLNPDTLIRLATNLKAEREKRQALEAQAAADRPKVVFAESIEVAKTNPSRWRRPPSSWARWPSSSSRPRVATWARTAFSTGCAPTATCTRAAAPGTCPRSAASTRAGWRSRKGRASAPAGNATSPARPR